MPEAVFESDRLRGGAGEGGDGFARLDEFDGASERVILGEGRPGDRSGAAQHRETLAHRHVERAEAVVAVADARCRHRVGDERDAARCAVERELRDGRVHVHPVEDELERHAVVLEGCDHGTGSSVVDARHRVERVREHPRPPVERLPGLLEGCLGVPDRDRDAVLHQYVDRLECIRQLGSDRQEPQRAARRAEQLLDDARLRFEEVARVVGSTTLLREERALEVGTEHERVGGGEVGDRGEGGEQGIQRIGDEADERAGGAVRAVGGEARGDRLDARRRTGGRRRRGRAGR